MPASPLRGATPTSNAALARSHHEGLSERRHRGLPYTREAVNHSDVSCRLFIGSLHALSARRCMVAGYTLPSFPSHSEVRGGPMAAFFATSDVPVSSRRFTISPWPHVVRTSRISAPSRMCCLCCSFFAFVLPARQDAKHPHTNRASLVSHKRDVDACH